MVPRRGGTPDPTDPSPAPTLPAFGRGFVVAALALLALGATIASLVPLQHQAHERARHAREVTGLAERVLALAVDRETGVRGYLLTGDSAALAPELAARPALAPTIDSLVRLADDHPEHQRRARDVAAAVAAWEATYAHPVLSAPPAVGAPDAARETEGRRRFDAIRAAVRDFVALEEEHFEERARQDRLLHGGALIAVSMEALALLYVLLRLRRRLGEQAKGLLGQRQVLADQAQELAWRTLALEQANADLAIVLGERQATLDALRASEERWRQLVERSPEAIMLHREGRVLYANASLVELLGATEPAQLVGRALADFAAPEHHKLLAGAIAAMARGEFRRTPQEYHVVTLDGRSALVEARSVPLTHDGAPAVLTVLRDVTARREAERRVRLSEERLRLALDAARMVAWEHEVDPHGDLDAQVDALVADARVHPDDRARVHRLCRQTLLEHAPFDVEFRLAPADDAAAGAPPWRHAKGRIVFDESRSRLRFIGVSLDVTERKRLEAELTRQAYHDALTGLANRVLFRDRVAHALARARAERESGGGTLAVLFLDLDDFKAVNDGLGHAAGDRLLVAIAERLRLCARDGDTVARLGGDEFAVLVEDVRSDDEVARLADEIRAALRRPVPLDGREVTAAASIGIVFGAPGDEVDALLRNADLAMYRAKARGKGQVAHFEPAMHAAALERLALEADLAQALERGEMALVYQPVMALDDERPVGVEALLRWHHPTRGPVCPTTFIPLAEASGLIVPLGRWALREACRQAVAWLPLAGGALSLGVNLSGRQLEDSALLDDVAAVLADTGLPPHCLTLEITESVLMRDMTATLATLRALKALGVRLAVDDFGTGYSSLHYLQRFPIDVLKIDRSFVEGVARGGNDLALMRTILALGGTLGLDTVAEGVETPEQRDALRALGCMLAQGYLWALPAGPDRITSLLERSGAVPAM